MPNAAHDNMSRSRVPQVAPMSNQSGSKSLHQSTATTSPHPTTPTTKDRKSRNARGSGVGAYGSLGRATAGRVPLHRRGTSSKYESLEDLLKEAGYKETRIFTPESDRNTKTRGASNPYDSDGALQHGRALKSSLRGGVGAFVGFFTGLVASKVEDNAGGSGPVAGPEYTTPASPSPSPYPSRPAQHRQSFTSSSSLHQHQHQHQLARNNSSTQLSSSMESLPHWNPQSEQSGVSSRNSAYPRPGQRSNPYVYGSSYVQASTSSLRLPQVETIPESPSNPSSSHSHRNSYIRQPIRPPNRPANLRVPQPLSGAGALLRHIASESSLLPERPQSTPPSSASRLTFSQHEDDFQSNRNSVLARNEAKHSWLQSVARTMLLGVPHSSDPPYITSTKDTLGGDTFPHSSINPNVSRRPGLARTVSNQSHRRPPPTINLSNQHSPISERPPANWGSTSDLLPSRDALSKPTLHRSASAQSSRLGTSPASNLLAPPSLSRLGLQRSAQSEGEVSRARVVVRSAPGSRANSRVRQTGSVRGQSKNKDGSTIPDNYDDLTPEDMFKHLMAERQKELRLARRGRPKGKGKRADDLDLPVLAKTKVEGDIWGMRRRNDAAAKQEQRKGADEKGAKTLATKHGVPNVRDRRDSEATIMERRGRDKTRENRYISGWGMQLPSPSPSPQRTHSTLPPHSPASSLSHSISIRESSSSSSARRHTQDGGSSGLAEDEDDSSNGDTSDSSEDGVEIDLARILVPAKRQSSIRSLRRHLVTQPRMAPPPLPSHGPFPRDDDPEHSLITSPLARRHVRMSGMSEEYTARDSGPASS